MFKKKIKEKYDACNTRELFLKIRKELKNFNFKKELEFLKKKINVFDRMILGIDKSKTGSSKDKYVNYGNYILTYDRFDVKQHYLLIPKDISYFNVLTLKKEDISMLIDMKKVIKENLGEKNLYFHCYPFNSVHTLHLHAVDEKDYVSRKNNLFIDDVIYVLENENIMNLGIEDRLNDFKELVRNWFENHELSLLNIYTLCLIIIEQSEKNENKKSLISYSINFILDILLTEGKIDEKETALKYFFEEKESLEAIGEMLLYIAKNPILLQKN